MYEYRYDMFRLKGAKDQRTMMLDDGTIVVREYDRYETFKKWINSDLGVAIFEQILRKIAGDTPRQDALFRLVSDNMPSKASCSCNSKLFADLYYEVKLAYHYGVNFLCIDPGEAHMLIESTIRKVRVTGSDIDVTTILNEKDVHGKL